MRLEMRREADGDYDEETLYGLHQKAEEKTSIKKTSIKEEIQMKRTDSVALTFWFCVAVTIAVWFYPHHRLLSREQLAQRPEITVPSTAPRPCVSYPYSLIKCGVFTNPQLDEARRDPALSVHYSDIGHVKPVRLDYEAYLYASFMVNGKIFWTPHRIALAKGETVLMDGQAHMIRERCGNRLSVKAELPTMPMPPELERNNPIVYVPEAPVNIPADLSFTPLAVPYPGFAAPVPAPVSPLAPVTPTPWPHGGFWIPFGVPPVIAAVPPHVGITPEPDSLLLFISALCAIPLVVKGMALIIERISKWTQRQ